VPPPVTTADKNTQQPIRDRLYTLALSLAEKLNHVANDEDILRQLANQLADEARAIGRDEADVYPIMPADSLVDTLLSDYAKRQAAALANGGVVGVRTGLEHLDETLNGLEPGKLYLLAAMPGAGKTTLALQIAATAALAGRYALYLSLENDATDLARKLACRMGKVSYTLALKGKLDPATWAAAVGELARLRGHLYLSTPRDKMPEISSLVETIMVRQGAAPAVIVVDYLQAWVKRAAGSAEAADVRERLDRFTPALRDLGERYGCAILAISSQNRSGYDKGGQAALKESGDLEYGADAVMTLARVEDTTVRSPGDTTVALKLTVEKNRMGLTGRPIMLDLIGDRCMVVERPS